MRLNRKVLMLVLFMLMPALGQTNIIMCKDASGKTHTSDRPIPECEGRAVRKFGKTGMVVREEPAPLTEEEKQRKKEEQEKQREIQRVQAEQKRADSVLLATYHNEGAIIAARARASTPLQERLVIQREELARAKVRFEEVRVQQSKQVNASNEEKYNLGRKVDDAQRMMNYRHSKLRETEAELAEIEKKYDGMLRRYRELTMQPSLQPVVAKP